MKMMSDRQTVFLSPSPSSCEERGRREERGFERFAERKRKWCARVGNEREKERDVAMETLAIIILFAGKEHLLPLLPLTHLKLSLKPSPSPPQIKASQRDVHLKRERRKPCLKKGERESWWRHWLIYQQANFLARPHDGRCVCITAWPWCVLMIYSSIS